MRLACLCRSRDRSGGMAKVGLWLRYLSVGLGLWLVLLVPTVAHADGVRGGPRNSDSLLRWDPDPGEGVWHATEETELSG